MSPLVTFLLIYMAPSFIYCIRSDVRTGTKGHFIFLNIFSAWSGLAWIVLLICAFRGDYPL